MVTPVRRDAEASELDRRGHGKPPSGIPFPALAQWLNAWVGMALEVRVAAVREIDVFPPGIVGFESHGCGPPKVFPYRAIRLKAALSHPAVPKVEVDPTGVLALIKVLIVEALTELLNTDPGKVRVAPKRVLPGAD